jgi:hypothetical protein
LLQQSDTEPVSPLKNPTGIDILARVERVYAVPAAIPTVVAFYKRVANGRYAWRVSGISSAVAMNSKSLQDSQADVGVTVRDELPANHADYGPVLAQTPTGTRSYVIVEVSALP